MRKKILLLAVILSSCSSGYLKYNGKKNISKNVDFEDRVKIVSADTVPDSNVSNQVPAEPPSSKKKSALRTKSGTKTTKGKKSKLPVLTPVVVPSLVRLPELEDHVGFEGDSRRPKVDPFRVGETVTHAVRYFATDAGTLIFKVKPFVEVNNRKSYNFLTDLKTSGLFSKFYSVDDQVETYVDYENLVPHVFKLHIKESAQLKEAQSYFDHKTLKATYWEHKYTEKNGNEEKKQEWDILDFSQNAFSGIFYMRIFTWEIGKEISFRVSDDEKNIFFKATAIKKEKLTTDAGEFDAIEIKARVVTRGALTQAGDITLWISDNDRKYILRIEAKIKIGSLISEVTHIDPGTKE